MSIIDKIKRQVTIFDAAVVLGLDVPYRERQSSFPCPFPDHEDMNPSCMVYPHTDRLWCFGCNRGGDVLDVTQIVLGGDINTAIEFWKRRLNIENGDPVDYAVIQQQREKSIVQGAYKTWRREAEQLLPKPTPENFYLFDGIWLEKEKIDERYQEVDTKGKLKEYIGELTEWLGWAKRVLGVEDEVQEEVQENIPSY